MVISLTSQEQKRQMRELLKTRGITITIATMHKLTVAEMRTIVTLSAHIRVGEITIEKG